MSPSLEGKEDQCFSLWLIEQLWIQNYIIHGLALYFNYENSLCYILSKMCDDTFWKIYAH